MATMPTPDPARSPDPRNNRLLAAMEAEDFARLEPFLETVDLPHGKTVYEIGEIVTFAYFPHDSVVSLVTVLEDGGSVEVAVFGRESVFGFVSAFISRESLGRYIVHVPGTTSRIAVARLQDAIEASLPLRQLFRLFVEALLAQTFQTVACNAVHNIEARCCRWILSTRDRIDQDQLPLTHESLAAMLGVQRSTISLVTRSLQTAGMITQSKGVITVTDHAGLEDRACECYGVIRRNFERLLPKTYAHP
jgi:CRP-like cAMP-binding protein